MKAAFLGPAASELAERLCGEGLEVEPVPASAAEVWVVDAALPEACRLAAEASVPVVWAVSSRSRELCHQARRLGVWGVIAREDDPGEIALLLESASRCRDLLRRVESLEKALRDRKTIERAKGWLMDRYGYKEREAFSRLRRMAMEARRPLVEVAEMVRGKTGKGN